MTDKERIKAEIESQLKIKDRGYSTEDAEYGYRDALEDILRFIDSLPKEPVSEDLEKESYHAAMRMVNNHDLILPSTTIAQLCMAYQIFFKEAANWQKEQMMKDVIDGKVIARFPLASEPCYVDAEIFVKYAQNLNEDDKVKLIIINETKK